MKPFFSVIIPALNEEQYIGTLLSALKNQTYKDFEVIIIDAKSTDSTLRVVSRFKNDIPLQTVSINEKNVSLSRNKGAEIAGGDYLFFIDADNSIPKSFLEMAKELIVKKNAQLVIPAVSPDIKSNLYRATYAFTNSLVIISKILKVGFSTGGNLIIDRSKFIQLGEFNKDIFVGEDHDLVKRAMKAKLKCEFMKKPKIVFSTRRLQKEKFSLVWKYVFSSVYIAAFGKITHKIYNYHMGGHYFKKKGNSDGEK